MAKRYLVTRRCTERADDMEYMWRRGKIEAICAVESPLVKAA